MQLNDDRRKWVIDLYFAQHNTYVEIAQIERIVPRNIHIILEEEKARQQRLDKRKERQHRLDLSEKAYQLFSEKKNPRQVAIALNLSDPNCQRCMHILEH